MRNLFKSALVIMLISVAPTLQSKDLVDPVVSTPRSESPISAETQRLTKRLEEIKAMDIGSMSNKEKRALRKEVKALEKEAKANNGVYLSVGALIIIILLLILLL